MDILSVTIIWLHEWQTLLAGLIAVVAAGIGWRAVSRQVQQTERHEQDRIRRNFEAARAGLAGSLVSIGEYADDSFEFSAKLIDMHQQNKSISGPISFHPPDLPTESISELRAMILNCTNKDVRSYIARMISDIQVQNSRMASTADDLNNPRSYVMVMRMNAIEGCIDALKVQAQSLGMLDYARRETDAAPNKPVWDDVINAATMFRSFAFEGELKNEILRRQKADYKTTLTD